MKKFAILLIAFLCFTVVLTATQADDTLESALTGLTEFTRDVRFDQEDMENFLTYWEEASDLEGLSEFEEDVDVDLAKVARDPDYREWAASQNLDPDDFLQKSMRVYAVHLRTTFPAQAEEIRASMGEEHMMENMPAGMSAEDIEAMRALMQQGLADLNAMEKVMMKLPEPTPSEQALLKAHEEELRILIDGEDYEDLD